MWRMVYDDAHHNIEMVKRPWCVCGALNQSFTIFFGLFCLCDVAGTRDIFDRKKKRRTNMFYTIANFFIRLEI